MVARLTALSCAIVLGLLIVPVRAAQVLTNGDFESGLTGWTGFVTAKGTISDIPGYAGGTPNQPGIKSFNTSGSGASNALWLNAGANPSSSTAEGGGVTQIFTTTGGTATFSADIAAHWMSRSASISSIGVFSVLIDGVLMDSHDFGKATTSQNGLQLLNSLDFTTTLAAGQHTLTLQVLREFAPGRNVEAEYFDNISLDVVAPVPEPATWAMMILGFAGIGFLAYRRRPGGMACSA